MKKILLAFILTTLVYTGVYAAGGQQGGAASAGSGNNPVNITLATGDAIGSMRNLMGERFKTELEKMTDLNLTVNHVQGPVLGSASQIMDQVVEGSVHIFGNDISWVAPYDRDFNPMSFGFMFRDIDHMIKYFESPAFTNLADKVAKSSNMRIVAPVPTASRMFFSIKPLAKASDFRGLKIRAPGLEMFVKSYEAYGASPTTVAWNEIFLALKTGLVEAAHGPASDVIANKWHLAAPYITKTTDMFAANAWYINEAFWQKLSAAQQEGIKKAMAITNQWCLDESVSLEEKDINTMVSEGATYSGDFPAAEREILRNQAIEAVKKLEASGAWSAGLVDTIQGIR
jgi:TRAP-type C4-dicarboxylate transport system substrate-binding protein